jgi:hypothetical protein
VSVQGPKLAIVVALLLAQDVLAECVVRYGKVAVKELGEWIVNRCTTSKDLGVVGVEI